MRRHWPLAAVLLVQAGILAAMAGPPAVARVLGTEITLRTAPVDPFDVLSGYHLVLSYEIENEARALAPEGLRRGDRVWLLVKRGDPAWELVSVSRERPETPPDHAALPARWDSFRAIIEGAGRIYVPETQRERAEELTRAAREQGLVDLRVGADGTVAPLRLRIGGGSFGD